MQVRQSVLVFVLALAGCMKPNPLIDALGDASEDASDSETGDGDPGDGDPGDGDPGDGDPGDGDPGDGDPGDGDPGDGDPGDGDPGDSDGENVALDMPGGESCEPLEPFEPACAECLALDCCELTRACADVDECLCLADCRLGGGSPGTCKNTCGGVAAKDVDELEPLLECANTACEQAC